MTGVQFTFVDDIQSRGFQSNHQFDANFFFERHLNFSFVAVKLKLDNHAMLERSALARQARQYREHECV